MSSTVPERRRLERAKIRKPASLIVERRELIERVPSIILDVSQKGLRISDTSSLNEGQVVEVVLGEHHTIGYVLDGPKNAHSYHGTRR